MSGRPHEISIGVGAPLSGEAAALGLEMRQAVELAVEDCNADGGVLGLPVTTACADDEGAVAAGENVARDFCSKPDLLGIVGHYNSDVTVAASDIYASNQVAMITPIASTPALTERSLPNVFRFTNRDDETGKAIVHHLYHVLGKRRAAMVETDSAYGRSMGEAFSRAFLALGGKVVQRHTVRQGGRDLTELIASLPAGFDFLFYGGSFEGAAILRAMRKAGLGQLFASGDGCWDRINFLEPAADVASAGEGVLVLSATPEPGRVPGAAEFAARYAERHGEIGNYAVNSYDSARVLIAAISDAAGWRKAPPSRTEVIEAMRRIRFNGIAYKAPVRWNEKGDNLAAVTSLNVVRDGRFRQVAEIGQSSAPAAA